MHPGDRATPWVQDCERLGRCASSTTSDPEPTAWTPGTWTSSSKPALISGQRGPVDSIADVDTDFWFKFGPTPTVRRIIDQIRLIEEVDLSYPIILGVDGRVMDGMHRIARASWMATRPSELCNSPLSPSLTIGPLTRGSALLRGQCWIGGRRRGGRTRKGGSPAYRAVFGFSMDPAEMTDRSTRHPLIFVGPPHRRPGDTRRHSVDTFPYGSAELRRPTEHADAPHNP